MIFRRNLRELAATGQYHETTADAAMPSKGHVPIRAEDARRCARQDTRPLRRSAGQSVSQSVSQSASQSDRQTGRQTVSQSPRQIDRQTVSQSVSRSVTVSAHRNERYFDSRFRAIINRS